jgi:tRNA dimethylallyltransferase
MSAPAPQPILIAGPTASGKSALALAIAGRVGGAIINADSMQVYRELHILTARPSADDEARTPHRLYGHVSVLEPYSVARWLEDVAGVLEKVRVQGLRPIIVGGTGLYFKALTEGLSPLPGIPTDIRSLWRGRAKLLGPGALHDELHQRDPVMAVRLEPGDTQRITRALEVFDGTGKSLAHWQSVMGTPLVSLEASVKILVDRPRAELIARADGRFDDMIAQGAIDEVRAALALDPPADAPALRALGFQQLAGVLAGRISLETAADLSRIATRQYIKRQHTWLNRHMIAWKPVQLSDYCEFDHRFMHNIDL